MLPAFTKAAGFADHILTDLNGSKGAWKDVAIGAGGLAALFTGKKLVSGIESAFQTGETALRGIGKLFNIPGLSNIGKGAPAGRRRLTPPLRASPARPAPWTGPRRPWRARRPA